MITDGQIENALMEIELPGDIRCAIAQSILGYEKFLIALNSLRLTGWSIQAVFQMREDSTYYITKWDIYKDDKLIGSIDAKDI